jgi:hypothetical protein
VNAFLGREKLTLPPTMGPEWTLVYLDMVSCLACFAEGLDTYSAAPLLPGVFPDLKQSNVVSRYTCGSRWGTHEALTHPIFGPLLPLSQLRLPTASQTVINKIILQQPPRDTAVRARINAC